MDQIINLWLSLDVRRRVVIVLAAIAMTIAVLGVSRLATAPGSALLFSGLEESTAGEIVTALEQRGVVYTVKGSAIYVPSAQRDELRMSLAGEGLPGASVTGYELLDTLSGFGTTGQMFDTAYWRAMEGELARTILSSPNIKTARVHVGRPLGSSMSRSQGRTASVTVTAASGSISSGQARALRYLVGSAVAGLNPDRVTVVDGISGQVYSEGVQDTGPTGVDERSTALKNNVERLLEARVGPGNVVVEVAVEAVTETETISQRTIDPDSRVVISTETEENTLDATQATPGVTVASNLPTGDSSAGSAGRSQNNQTRERTNFEVGETQREIHKTPGAIKKLSVAVLVNSVDFVNENGQQDTAPRSAEELENLRALVASAVGYDEQRGDLITIHSMAFEPLPELGTIAAPSFVQSMNIDVMQISKLVLLSIVVLVLGFGVIRPIAMNPALATRETMAIEGPQNGPIPTFTGEIQDSGAPFPTLGAPSTLTDGPPETGTSDLGDVIQDPVERLRQLIDDRQEESVDILRGWIEKDEETA